MKFAQKVLQTSGLSLVLLTAASCSNDKKPETADPPKATADPARVTTSMRSHGSEAGGTVQETIRVTAIVADMDKTARTVKLTGADGHKSVFHVPPEARNFDQIRVGDKVTATVISTLAVMVAHGDRPEVTHTEATGQAPKGTKPSAVVAEAFELSAAVKSIDKEKRTATLEFDDGEQRVVHVRPDVDLNQYHVGDSVIVHASQALQLLVQSP